MKYLRLSPLSAPPPARTRVPGLMPLRWRISWKISHDVGLNTKQIARCVRPLRCSIPSLQRGIHCLIGRRNGLQARGRRWIKSKAFARITRRLHATKEWLWISCAKLPLPPSPLRNLRRGRASRSVHALQNISAIGSFALVMIVMAAIRDRWRWNMPIRSCAWSPPHRQQRRNEPGAAARTNACTSRIACSSAMLWEECAMTDLSERLREHAALARKQATPIALGQALHFEAAADEIERLRAALVALANAEALKGVRGIVAGWNGEGTPEPYQHRHPAELGATMPKTNCGAIYALDEAMQRARSVLSPAERQDVDLYRWPIGCKHPNSCQRRGECMYLGCAHHGKPVRASTLPSAEREGTEK